MNRLVPLLILLVILIGIIAFYHEPIAGLISSIVLKGEFSFGGSDVDETSENKSFIPPPGSSNPSGQEGQGGATPSEEQEEQVPLGGTPTQGIDEAPEESGIVASIREPEPEVLLSGEFVSGEVEVSGLAQFIEGPQERLIRFENFSIVPASYEVYLSENLEVTNAILIDDLKATNGESNYDLDVDLDLSIYDHVLIWNGNLAGYAELD